MATLPLLNGTQSYTNPRDPENQGTYTDSNGIGRFQNIPQWSPNEGKFGLYSLPGPNNNNFTGSQGGFNYLNGRVFAGAQGEGDLGYTNFIQRFVNGNKGLQNLSVPGNPNGQYTPQNTMDKFGNNTNYGVNPAMRPGGIFNQNGLLPDLGNQNQNPASRNGGVFNQNGINNNPTTQGPPQPKSLTVGGEPANPNAVNPYNPPPQPPGLFNPSTRGSGIFNPNGQTPNTNNVNTTQSIPGSTNTYNQTNNATPINRNQFHPTQQQLQNPFGSIGHSINMNNHFNIHGEPENDGSPERSLVPNGYQQAFEGMRNGTILDYSKLHYDPRVGWINPIDNFITQAPSQPGGWGDFLRTAWTQGIRPGAEYLGGAYLGSQLGSVLGSMGTTGEYANNAMSAYNMYNRGNNLYNMMTTPNMNNPNIRSNGRNFIGGTPNGMPNISNTQGSPSGKVMGKDDIPGGDQTGGDEGSGLQPGGPEDGEEIPTDPNDSNGVNQPTNPTNPNNPPGSDGNTGNNSITDFLNSLLHGNNNNSLGSFLSTLGLGAFSQNRDNQNIQNFQHQIDNLFGRGDYNAQYRPGQTGRVNDLLMNPSLALQNPQYQAFRQEQLQDTSRNMAARGLNLSGNELGALQNRQAVLDQSQIKDERQAALQAAGQGDPSGLARSAMQYLPFLFMAQDRNNAGLGSLLSRLLGGGSNGNVGRNGNGNSNNGNGLLNSLFRNGRNGSNNSNGNNGIKLPGSNGNTPSGDLGNSDLNNDYGDPNMYDPNYDPSQDGEFGNGLGPNDFNLNGNDFDFGDPGWF